MEKLSFVTNQTFDSFAICRGQHGGLKAVLQRAARTDDFVPYALGRRTCSISRKIRTEEAALTGNGVTTRTFSLAEENLLTSLRVAGESPRLAPALKRADVRYNRADLIRRKGSKRRHAGSWYTVLNDAGKLSVRKPAYFRASGNVHSFIAASPVQTVAGSTGRVIVAAPRLTKTPRSSLGV